MFFYVSCLFSFSHKATVATKELCPTQTNTAPPSSRDVSSQVSTALPNRYQHFYLEAVTRNAPRRPPAGERSGDRIDSDDHLFNDPTGSSPDHKVFQGAQQPSNIPPCILKQQQGHRARQLRAQGRLHPVLKLDYGRTSTNTPYKFSLPALPHWPYHRRLQHQVI
jgi:hypothetical protein